MTYDPVAYKGRNGVERAFNAVKQWWGPPLPHTPAVTNLMNHNTWAPLWLRAEPDPVSRTVRMW